MNKYKIGFIGGNMSDEIIIADSERHAKRIFADKHNVIVSSYIVTRRHKYEKNRNRRN